MALKHLGEFLAKSKVKDGDLKSLYLYSHIKDTLIKFSDWQKRVESVNFNDNGKILENDDFKKSVIKALFLHDLGKVSFKFQKRIIDTAEIEENEKESFRRNILDEELKSIRDLNLGRHEFYSLIWSFLFLDKDNYYTPLIRTAVLYHHYNDFYSVYTDSGIVIFEDRIEEVSEYLKFIKSKRDLVFNFLDVFLKDPELSEFVKNTIEELKNDFYNNYTNIDNIIKAFQYEENISDYIKVYDPGISNTEIKELDEKDYQFILLLGILRRCDYASGSDVDIENDSESVLRALENAIPNDYEWQNEIIKEIKNENYSNKHIVFFAPTGSGKTELAFLWGALDKKRKLIYTLPLRVALNDIYNNRVLNGYLKDFSDKDKNINLLHSTFFLEYFGYNQNETIDIEIKENSARLFSSGLLFTTADQVFLSSLFYYGFDKLFAIFPYSSFVIDEIQSYTPEMMAIIFKTIHYIDKLGGRILIMTATLPPYLKNEELINAVIQKDKVCYLDQKIISIKNKIKNYNLKRHKIEIRNKSLVRVVKEKSKLKFKYIPDEETIKEIIKEKTDKNILVILNNVQKAISFYDSIKKELKNDKEKSKNTFLLHSRLLEGEKRRRIEKIKELLKTNKKGIILIATQIVEASVDVDFDILYTEISPIDSQIQRWGRIFRNRKENYNNSEPNIIIYLGSDEDKEDNSLRFSKTVYSEDVLNKTIGLFKNFNNSEVLSFEDEKRLLDEVFDQELVKNYVKKILKNLEFLKYFKVEKKSQAQNIFRRLAGRYVVFLKAMLNNNDKDEDSEKIKRLAEYLKKNINRLKEITWKEIEKEVFNGQWSSNDKYKVKKWLLDYSVNVPEYYFNKLEIYKEFKGFYICDDEIGNDKVSDLIEKGFDAIRYDIDNEELQLAEDYII